VFLRAKVQKSLQLAMLHKERLLSRPEEAKVAGLDVDADCKTKDEIDDCEEEEEEEEEVCVERKNNPEEEEDVPQIFTAIQRSYC
jgi:hypothetical protein